jgi:crossover junction endodeoxyribonuclease RuvC
MKKSERIILGIDPGTTIMGYGIIRVTGNSELEMIEMGALHLSKYPDHALKLKKIFDRCVQLIDTHTPDGRAQGVAFAAALSRDLHIAEYAPRKIKKSVTGSGAASKEQVSAMVQRIFKIPQSAMPNNLDATDGIAVALCHHYQLSSPEMKRGVSGWKAFIKENPSRVKS